MPLPVIIRTFNVVGMVERCNHNVLVGVVFPPTSKKNTVLRRNKFF